MTVQGPRMFLHHNLWDPFIRGVFSASEMNIFISLFMYVLRINNVLEPYKLQNFTWAVWAFHDSYSMVLS